MTEEMTIQEYLDRYGEIQIIDKEEDGSLRRVFFSNPEQRVIGGSLKAKDINQIGMF